MIVAVVLNGCVRGALGVLLALSRRVTDARLSSWNETGS